MKRFYITENHYSVKESLYKFMSNDDETFYGNLFKT